MCPKGYGAPGPRTGGCFAPRRRCKHPLCATFAQRAAGSERDLYLTAAGQAPASLWRPSGSPSEAKGPSNEGSAGTEGPRAANASRGIWKWGIPRNHGFDPRIRQVTVTYEARCLVDRRATPSGSLIRHRAPIPKPAHFAGTPVADRGVAPYYIQPSKKSIAQAHSEKYNLSKKTINEGGPKGT